VAATAASAALTSLVHDGKVEEIAMVPAATPAVLMKSRRDVVMKLGLLMVWNLKGREVFNPVW
jgi:hypothetical protein